MQAVFCNVSEGFVDALVHSVSVEAWPYTIYTARYQETGAGMCSMQIELSFVHIVFRYI